MIAGVSQARSYNPSFGYRLESLPPAKLELGEVLTERDSLFVKTREIVYLLFKQRRAPLLPILQGLNGRGYLGS